MVAYEIFGDSNIARSWKAVASDGGKLAGSVLRQTTTLVSLRDTLKTVGQSTRFILVSALTNPITRLKYECVAQIKTASGDCFDEILDLLVQTANNNPELKLIFHLFGSLYKRSDSPSTRLLPRVIIPGFRVNFT
jgi:hypothetical protein